METQANLNVQVTEVQAATASTTTGQMAVPTDRNYGWDNVHSQNGVEISLFGMAIVFTGLVFTFFYISLLPRIVGERKPKVKVTKAPQLNEAGPAPAPAATSLSPELQAAIAYVIAAEQEYEQLTDYTKLTIRRDENQQAWGVAGKMRTLVTRKLN